MSKAKLKVLYILLAVLAVAGIATFAVSRHEEKKEEIKNSDEVILTIPTEDVTALSWEYDDTSLSFQKNETWTWDDDAAFPVDEETINNLLSRFASFGVSFIIEDVTDYSQYGLDDPTCVIRITADGEDYEISLGTYSTMDEERYVSTGDGNVYLVEQDPLEDFELTINDLILNDEIPTLSEVSQITFSGDEAYEISRQENSDLSWCEDDIYFTDDKPLDTDSVSNYLTSVQDLVLGAYASYNVTDEELAAYGLDTPDLSVSVTYSAASEDSEESYEDSEDTSEDAGVTSEDEEDTSEAGEDTSEAENDTSEEGDGTSEETFTLHLGRNQEELSDALAEADSEDSADLSEVTAYVRIGDSQIVYEITNDEYNTLAAASYDDLRHKEIVTASFDDVTQIDISLEDEDYTLTPGEEKDEDGETLWQYDDKEAFSLSGIQSAISSLTADSFTSEEGDGKEEISFTLTLDNETWPEIQVSLYRCDGDSCLAVVNGTPTAYVPRSQVVSLIEAVNDIVLN